MTIRRTLAGVAAAVLLLAGCTTTGHIDTSSLKPSTKPPSASSSTPDFTPPATEETPTPVPSGPDKLVMGQAEGLTQDGENAGDIILAGLRVTTRPGADYGSKPSHGYFVIVGVTATAFPTFTTGFDISTTDFYLLAKHGQHFDEGGGNSYDALSDSSQELGYTTLAAGETASGKLVFDVPSLHGYIVYAPNIDGQPLAEWKY